MKIKLTKEQFINLLTMSHITNSVLGILGDVLPETDYKKKSDEMEGLEKYLLRYAQDFDCGDMVEDFHRETIMKEEIYEEMNDIIEDYDDYIFWNELETRMGKRDFGRTITKEEGKYIEENNGWFPERIHEIYEKYRKEFEENGIERLKIAE
ncbi:MAG: hypothetical protein KKD35_07220 [Elusimicrobia bacterium]|nr:hypothetical protein [Elusimicrobiota bacterium]